MKMADRNVAGVCVRATCGLSVTCLSLFNNLDMDTHTTKQPMSWLLGFLSRRFKLLGAFPSDKENVAWLLDGDVPGGAGGRGGGNGTHVRNPCRLYLIDDFIP